MTKALPIIVAISFIVIAAIATLSVVVFPMKEKIRVETRADRRSKK